MKLLLVEDDASVLELLLINAKAEWPAIEILCANDGAEAKQLLEKNQYKVPVVISDYSMPAINGGELFKLILKNNPQCKFVLCTARNISDIPEFQGSAPYFQILKPGISEGIKKLSEKMMQGLLDSTGGNEITPDFIPVTLQILEKAASCPCPLYVKLRDNKYVRIFQQDDPFTHTDYEKYKKKGIESLHILREDLGKFSKYLENTLAHFLKEKSEDEITPKDMIKMHEMGLQFFRLPFMTDEQVALTKQWIGHTQKFFSTPKNKSVANRIAELLDKSSPQFLNHLNLCVFFSIELAHTLTWTNESTLFKLTMASLLHDVALPDSDRFDFSQVNLDWRKASLTFRQHPKDGASLIQMLRDVPPDVDRIILEHHELPNGEGFPKGLKGNQIAPLSAIFILAHCLATKSIEATGKHSLEKSVLLAKIPTYFYEHSPWKELLRDYAVS